MFYIFGFFFMEKSSFFYGVTNCEALQLYSLQASWYGARLYILSVLCKMLMDVFSGRSLDGRCLDRTLRRHCSSLRL